MKMRSGIGWLSPLAALALLLSGGCPKGQGPVPDGGGPAVQTGPAGPAAPSNTPQPPPDAADTALVEKGKAEYRNCGMCHCETDPAVPWDEDWVNLNAETTCIGGGAPEPEVRKAIMAYLRHPDTLRPLLVDGAFRPPLGMKTGRVSVPPVAGSAYLKASREAIQAGSPAMVRLVWGKTPEEKPMTAPAGAFTVINYWMYRLGGADGSDRWSVSVTNVDGCADLWIAEGEDCWLVTEALLKVEFSAARTEGGAALTFELYDIGGNRASLTCNGHMVFPRYEILDEDGTVLDSAVFEVT